MGYGLCGKGGPGFGTKEECLKKCKKSNNNQQSTSIGKPSIETGDTSEEDGMVGSGDGRPYRTSCYTWTYGLCGNGGPGYGTKEECPKNCKNSNSNQQPTSIGKPSIESEDTSEEDGMIGSEYGPRCNQSPGESGLCRAWFPRWTFSNNKCHRFIYGGCGGNENSFKTKTDCLATC